MLVWGEAEGVGAYLEGEGLEHAAADGECGEDVAGRG